MKKIILTEFQFKNLVENIINENSVKYYKDLVKKKHVVEMWFEELMSELTQNNTHKDTSIFWFKEEYDDDLGGDVEVTYLEYDAYSKILWIDKSRVYDEIATIYTDNENEISNLVKDMMIQHSDIKTINSAKPWGLNKELDLGGLF
jgi:hypothetical protein